MIESVEESIEARKRFVAAVLLRRSWSPMRAGQRHHPGWAAGGGDPDRPIASQRAIPIAADREFGCGALDWI